MRQHGSRSSIMITDDQLTNIKYYDHSATTWFEIIFTLTWWLQREGPNGQRFIISVIKITIQSRFILLSCQTLVNSMTPSWIVKINKSPKAQEKILAIFSCINSLFSWRIAKIRAPPRSPDVLMTFSNNHGIQCRTDSVSVTLLNWDEQPQM